MKKTFMFVILSVFLVMLSSCGGKQYTVTFDLDGKGIVNGLSVKEGGLVTRPSPDPTYEGFIFKGWFKDAEREIPWQFSSFKITKDTILYAKWVEGEDVSDPIETFDLGGAVVQIYTSRAEEFDPNYVTNSSNPFAVRWHEEDTVYWSIIENLVDDIETKYNCKLKFVDANNYASSWNHLKEKYASNSMYDIVAITGEEFPYMYANDMVQELPDNLLPDNVINLFWGGKDGFQYNSIKHLGSRWGVSLSNTIFDITNTAKDYTYPQLLYYNKDILTEAGITKMPDEYFLEGTWSWEIFETMINQIRTSMPSVNGLADHAYNAGIMNFLGSNGTFLFDSYGELGFYSNAAQEVYSKWNTWYNAKIIYNYTYETGTIPDSYLDQKWFQEGLVAFTSGRYTHAVNYWKDIDYSIVPYPYGPNASNSEGKLDESKYISNIYSPGYFWMVPKGKDAAKMYQIIAEFMGGLKEYYTDADDEEQTIKNFSNELFSYGDEGAYQTLLFIQRTMNLSIVQSAIPNGIFRQAIREHYTKGSNYYGQMFTYMQSRRAELDQNNPNNFWKSIFGAPGNTTN